MTICGVGEGPRNVGRRVAMVGVLVRDQDVAERERTLGDRIEDRRRQTGRIDQRGRASVVEEEEITVGGMRIVRVMAHVTGQRDVRFPAPRGGVGEFSRVESQQLASARASASPGAPSPFCQATMLASASPLRAASAAGSSPRPRDALRKMSQKSSSSIGAFFACAPSVSRSPQSEPDATASGLKGRSCPAPTAPSPSSVPDRPA